MSLYDKRLNNSTNTTKGIYNIANDTTAYAIIAVLALGICVCMLSYLLKKKK